VNFIAFKGSDFLQHQDATLRVLFAQYISVGFGFAKTVAIKLANLKLSLPASVG